MDTLHKYFRQQTPKRIPGSGKDRPRKDRQSGQGPGPPNDNFQWRRIWRTLALWLIIISVALYVSQRLTIRHRGEQEIDYHPDFTNLLENRQVLKVDIQGKELHGELREARPAPGGSGEAYYTKFKVILNAEPTQDVVDTWKDTYGISEIKFSKEAPGFWNMIFAYSPWILLIVIWFYFIRRMQGAGTKGIFSFGKSRAKLLTENQFHNQ